MLNALTYILIIVMIFMIVATAFVTQRYVAAKKELKLMQEEINELKDEYKLKTTEYSKTLLEYIKTFTAQVAAINFRNFLDTHELEKVTKTTVSKLVEDTARLVNDSINEHNIIFQDALFTRDFYDKYIIDISMISIKDLLEKAVNNINE